MSRYTDEAELDNWFAYHPPSSPAIMDGHEFVRRECRELASMLNKILPECAEKTLALRKIREASMWGNAAIACKQEVGERPWVARVASITVTRAPELSTIDLRDEYRSMTADAFIEAGREIGRKLLASLDAVMDGQSTPQSTREYVHSVFSAAVAKASLDDGGEPDASTV